MDSLNEILYIGGFELPDKNAAAQRVIANGKIFRDLGYAVYFMGSDRSLLVKSRVKLTKDSFEGFTFYRVKYPSTLNEWYHYISKIDDVIQIMDELPYLKIIIAYNYPAIALYRLTRICSKKKICIIADCTEWYQPHGNILYKIIRGVDTYLRMKFVHIRLNGMIAISSFLYEFYQKRMSNVIQIPPLVDLESFKWKHADTPGNNKIILVYAGFAGSGNKDRLDFILKALSSIKKSTNIDFTLKITGLTREQYIEDFGSVHLTEYLISSVVFKGKLSHIQALYEIKTSDYAIIIRDNNRLNTAGFPTKFVEAYSAGIPVIANSFSNILDFLKHGYNGFLLDITSDDTLFETLRLALSYNRNKIKEIKNNIISDKDFDYRKYLEKSRRFIETIIIPSDAYR